MSLRLKLLISFSLSAFCALTLFGLVAYDTALEESEKNESRLIFTILNDEVKHTIEALETTKDVSQRLASLSHTKELMYYVVNDQGQAIYSSQALNRYIEFDISKLAKEENKHGHFEIDEQEFHWRAFDLSNVPYTVIAVYHHKPDATNSFLVQMALSLAVTAFIVTWVAAWSALYIASLVERLNQQKVELEKLATHDNLTGLPNRMLLIDRIEQAIQFSEREKYTFALCFLDLNKFKEINDTLGHRYGDKVLEEVAKRLVQAIRKSDTVARLGGDELAVVLNKTDKAGAEIVVEKMIHLIEQPMIFNNKPYHISASVGIATYPKNAQDANALIKKADDAMYVAKRGGLRFQHFDDIPVDDISDSEMVHSDFSESDIKPAT